MVISSGQPATLNRMRNKGKTLKIRKMAEVLSTKYVFLRGSHASATQRPGQCHGK